MRSLAGDVIIATDCWTAFPVAAATNFKERFYFIQDHEPSFHPAGENQLMADLSYKFGFAALCAGKWLNGLAEARGDWTRSWNLAADPSIYYPGLKSTINGERIRIAFYARQFTPRRAVRLGFAALDELHRRGVNMIVHLFGEENIDLDGVEFNYKRHGVLSPSALGDLYRECDIGLVFSATNYSLIPLEMMACGLPVVELDVPSTRAIFENGEVCFAQPTPHQIADAVQLLAGDATLRSTQIKRAYEYVNSLSWEQSARAIESALIERLNIVGARGILPDEIIGTSLADPSSPAIVARREASVFIPAFNAGAAFEVVLNAVASQVCTFEFDVLVIDSGSSDQTCDLVRKFAGRNVRLETIPNSEFQHGRTRNLGIRNTDGRYVAILTQDAMPKDEHWLQNLIGGFAQGDRVAGVIGRHEAYPEHDAFIKRDMREHFDALSQLPPVLGGGHGLPSYIYPGSEPWRMLMGFYSDNNSAMSRAVWKEVPYPEIDWGEDQVWAAEMLRLGFQKAYGNDAVVYHSHAFTPQQQYKVAATEGKFWAEHFGIRLHEDAEAAIAAMDARDRDFALRNGVADSSLKARLASNRATVNGRVAGWRAASN